MFILQRFLLICLILFSLPSCGVIMDMLDTSTVEDLKKLGTEPFDKEVWDNARDINIEANRITRGKMIYDFIKKNSPITEKSRDFIIEQLGKNVCYHDSEENPAYCVGHSPPNNPVNSYTVAFEIDLKANKVMGVVIYPEITEIK